MRQLVAFAKAIRVRNTVTEWQRMAFLAKLHKCEIQPLEEILGVPLGQMQRFDSKTDEILEKRARQLLAEKRMLQRV